MKHRARNEKDAWLAMGIAAPYWTVGWRLAVALVLVAPLAARWHIWLSILVNYLLVY